MKTQRLCRRLSYRLLVLFFLVPLSPLRAEVDIVTRSVVHISCTSVTLRAQFFSDEAIEDAEWNFAYWIKEGFRDFMDTKVQCCVIDGDTFETTITGLQPNTEYEFWAQVGWSDSAPGGAIRFVTSSDDPGFTTRPCAGPVSPTRTLTVSPSTNGTVRGIDAVAFDQGAIVGLAATADNGYVFDQWTGTAVANGKVGNPRSPTTDVTLDGNYSIQGTFKRDRGPAWIPVFSFPVLYDVPTNRNPNLSINVSSNRVVQLNFKADLKVEVAPTSAAGGVWTGSVVPSTINPGSVTVTISIQGNSINATALIPGARDVQIARVTFFARPAP